MVIYTKKGDRGETCVIGDRKKVSKASLKMNVVGAIDELNSFLGVVISFSNDSVLVGNLKKAQDDLLTLGSILAGSDLRFYKTKTSRLERQIDILEKKLPKLKNFIYPGGTISASLLHFARTIARRAEREIVALSEEENVRDEILVYMNRLSDYLFMLARKQNFEAGVGEVVWGEKK